MGNKLVEDINEAVLYLKDNCKKINEYSLEQKSKIGLKASEFCNYLKFAYNDQYVQKNIENKLVPNYDEVLSIMTEFRDCLDGKTKELFCEFTSEAFDKFSNK